jgi:hypothetical protein
MGRLKLLELLSIVFLEDGVVLIAKSHHDREVKLEITNMSPLEVGKLIHQGRSVPHSLSQYRFVLKWYATLAIGFKFSSATALATGYDHDM